MTPAAAVTDRGYQSLSRVNGFGADRTRQALIRSDARCRRSFYYGTRTAVPTLTPMPAGGLGEEISRVQTCCAPGPTYILKVGDMPGPGVRVPVQSAATV